MIELIYLIVFVLVIGVLVYIFRGKIFSLQSENAVLKERLTFLDDIQNKNKILNDELGKCKTIISELETTIKKDKEASVEKIELLQNSKEQMKLEFAKLAKDIFEDSSSNLTTQNKTSIENIIKPFKEQLDGFRKRVDDIYTEETKSRSMLQQELHQLRDLNLQMSSQAKDLVNALKGESKTQGSWGEMILERVLESSGLRLGYEYDREVSANHESNSKRYRPDVLVHLPENKDIIVDAKTSLSAYEKYSNCDDEEEKKIYASKHLDSINNHIKELSSKDYTKLEGIKTLDFVFMFIPIESALLLALQVDSSLFDRAFKKNILLVGPTTLMIALRAVKNSWKHENQQKNALNIAKRAGLLYDKFIGFVEDVENLGKNINTLSKTYDNARNKLHDGKGSLTSQLEKLKEMGAETNKRLPKNIEELIKE